MSRRIGVLNYKGGTAKTTTVVNLGAGLALRGARVLCVDLDPQGSLAMCLGARYTYSLTHMLLGQAESESCIAQARNNLDIIASDSSLLQAEGVLWRMNDGRAARRVLVNKLQGLGDKYDYILVDFSPSASILRLFAFGQYLERERAAIHPGTHRAGLDQLPFDGRHPAGDRDAEECRAGTWSPGTPLPDPSHSLLASAATGPRDPGNLATPLCR